MEPTPTTFDVREGTVPPLRGPQSIALRNAYHSEAKVSIYIGDGKGEKVTIDLKEFTDSAIATLDRHMAKSAIKHDAHAAKSITLGVRDVSFIPAAFTVLTALTLEMQLGDGTRKAFRVKNTSPSGARALDGAIMFGVTQLLNDPEFLDYLTVK